MQNKFIWIIIAIIIIGGGIWIAASNKNNNDNQREANTEQVDAVEKEDGAMMEKDGEAIMEDKSASGDTMMKTVGTYKDYSQATVDSEFAAGNKVVLFFHATWCPECKIADAAFKSKANEIPTGVTVLKTDYDSNTELKKKYGVTYQHTFVQIDAQGNEITQWSGGDIDNLKKYLK